MLKIKKDFPMSNLEKQFGMKPKYDEDTGKLYAYAYYGIKVRCDDRIIPTYYCAGKYYQDTLVEGLLIKLAKENLLEVQND